MESRSSSNQNPISNNSFHSHFNTTFIYLILFLLDPFWVGSDISFDNSFVQYFILCFEHWKSFWQVSERHFKNLVILAPLEFPQWLLH